MTSPRIVVGCGCYNDAQYLHDSIGSVLRQTVTDFGLLLFDNGSTDESGEVMREYARADSRIALIDSPSNLSPPCAANFGWGFAMQHWPDAEWFLGVGADDVMAEGYLEAVLEVAGENPDANMIYSPVTYIDHPERGVHRWPEYDPETVHAQPQIPGWRAITRELWSAVGEENTRIRIGADWEWAVRASALGVLRPIQLDRPYLSLRVRPPARPSQSSLVDWPRLHHTLCQVAGKRYPAWAVK